MEIPTEGRPTKPTRSTDLVGVDGNAFFVMGATNRLLKDAGATKEYRDAYMKEATSGDYNHVIQTSMAYLDAEPVEGAEA